ncbi:UNVERIFIED_ORG: hypothetical protein J2W16_001214 [Pseudomonas cremoricolorata]|nr:hypothetical protein [Pseudomonas cremoricolorata]
MQGCCRWPTTSARLVGEWLAKVANVRTHATLKERPLDRWRLEQGLLTPLCQALRQTWKTLLGSAPRTIPHESIQHPLAIYEAIREACE